MNYITNLLLATLLCLPLLAQNEDGAPKPESSPQAPTGELKTEEARGSYAFGMNVGKNLGPIASSLDLDLFIKGLRDSIAGDKLLLTDEEGREAFMAFQRKAMDSANAKNIKEGKDFLENNLKDKDVVQLASGLQYKVIKAGKGVMPKATDTVEVHYTGTFLDGSKFDSSRDRGEPATFPVGRVIKGWTEALQLMPTGAQWQLVVPSALAYGESGNQRIPPNSVLLFDVELLSIK